MRKSEVIKITDDGKELTFKITQMPATKAERWANRAAFLIIGAGKSVGKVKSIEDFGIDEALKVLATMDYEKVEPLYNELIECCSFMSGGAEIQCSQDTIDAQITDLTNLYKLRLAALKLNFSFFMNVLQFQAQAQDTITFKKTTRKSSH